MSKVNDTIVCVDISGSTGFEIHNYYPWLKSFIKGLPENVDFVEWDNFARKSTRQEILSRNDGNGGTNPQTFIKFIRPYQKVIVITDGQITSNDVSNCERELESGENNFTEVEFHFYYTGGEMDLSIATPFARNTKFKMYKYMHDPRQENKVAVENLAEGDNSVDIDLDQYYDNLAAFMKDAPQLLQSITMRQIGKSQANTNLKNKLCALQTNLKNCISNSNAANFDYDQIRTLLKSGDQAAAIEKINELTSTINHNEARMFDVAINRMISACDKLNGFSFDLL